MSIHGTGLRSGRFAWRWTDEAGYAAASTAAFISATASGLMASLDRALPARSWKLWEDVPTRARRMRAVVRPWACLAGRVRVPFRHAHSGLYSTVTASPRGGVGSNRRRRSRP